MEKTQIPSLNLDPNFERAMKIIAQTEITAEDRKKLMKGKKNPQPDSTEPHDSGKKKKSPNK